MTAKRPAGEDKAWEHLSGLDPNEVVLRSGATFDPAAGLYTVISFGAELRVSPASRGVAAEGDAGGLLLGELFSLFRFAVPWYLAYAKDIPPTGRLVRPDHLPGGDIFSRGSHVLPLPDVAGRYGSESSAFLDRGMSLGGKSVDYGDTAVEMYPFPRIPITMIFWAEDEEFPARADLLFDSTAEFQAPIDVLWAVSRMTVLMLWEG